MIDTSSLTETFKALLLRLEKGCPRCMWGEADGDLLSHCQSCQAEVTRLSFELYLGEHGTVLRSALDKAMVIAHEPAQTWAQRCGEMLTDLRCMCVQLVQGSDTEPAIAALNAHESLCSYVAKLGYHCMDEVPFERHPAKCDRNHGGLACSDPHCWQKSSG